LPENRGEKMDEGAIQYFDLTALLRINDPDIRKAANNNLSLHTSEYFDLLAKFLSDSEAAKESLTKISSLSGDNSDFKNIEDIKTLLVKIGSDKLASLTEEINKAIKSGNKNTAAEFAKKALSSYDDVYNHIELAKRDSKPETMNEILNADDKSYYNSVDTQLLHKTIKLIEHEESYRKLKILAVDDAPIMLKTIAATLDDYKVYGMSDPKMLKKFLLQIQPDLFLLDYKMPDLSGFDLVPIIREFPDLQNTPIIFLTSMGDAKIVSNALALGAADYIVKPFQGKQLREKVAKHLKLKID
jgi:CheY-like chemotaxis protein